MGLFSKKDKSKSASPAPAPQSSSYAPPPSHSPAPQQDNKAQNALFGNRPQIPSDQKANPYASNPYAAANAQQQQKSTSSYGGSNDDRDVKRDQLFSGRPQQQQQPAQGGYNSNPYERPGAGGYGAPPPYGSSESAGGSYGRSSGGPSNAYGNNGDSSYNSSGYGDPNRQLTAEEEEEEDVEAVKQQIRFTKQESVASTRNALRYAAEAEETGRNTLARLGQQSERLYNTEKNLDIAASHNRVAEEKARELKTLNGSMFAIHMKNPMKSKSRQQAEEQKILDRHQFEREERDRVRAFGYESKQNIDRALGGRAGYKPSVGKPTGMSLAERQKYQFEADEEDDEMEREIDANLTQLGDVAGRLKALAIATGQETDRQIEKISQITQKSDRVDDGITLTHSRIKKIH